ncbi:MAG: putative anti-sigma-YlaC factor YlaD, partial [Myxococcota bacterium]
METLLCRRVELARAGEPNGLQFVLQEHVTSCLHCRDEIAVDHAIRTSLRSEELLLPPVTRRRIEQLVTVRSRPHAPWAGLMMAALTGAAVALLAVG